MTETHFKNTWKQNSIIIVATLILVNLTIALITSGPFVQIAQLFDPRGDYLAIVEWLQIIPLVLLPWTRIRRSLWNNVAIHVTHRHNAKSNDNREQNNRETASQLKTTKLSDTHFIVKID